MPANTLRSPECIVAHPRQFEYDGAGPAARPLPVVFGVAGRWQMVLTEIRRVRGNHDPVLQQHLIECYGRLDMRKRTRGQVSWQARRGHRHSPRCCLYPGDILFGRRLKVVWRRSRFRRFRGAFSPRTPSRQFGQGPGPCAETTFPRLSPRAMTAKANPLPMR